jgi:hypothetical protein
LKQVDNDKNHGSVKEKGSFGFLWYFGYTVFEMFFKEIGHSEFSFIGYDWL